MSRQLLVFLGIIFYSGFANAQSLSNKHIKAGNRMLFGFAAANTGASALFMATNAMHADFHRTNVAWNTVNLAIGIIAISAEKRFAGQAITEQRKQLLNLEKAYLFNTALDVAYIVGGLWLRQTNHPELDMRQVGNAIIYNGAFLLLYDAYMIHRSAKYNRTWLYPLISVQPDQVRFGAQIHF